VLLKKEIKLVKLAVIYLQGEIIYIK